MVNLGEIGHLGSVRSLSPSNRRSMAPLAAVAATWVLATGCPEENPFSGGRDLGRNESADAGPDLGPDAVSMGPDLGGEPDLGMDAGNDPRSDGGFDGGTDMADAGPMPCGPLPEPGTVIRVQAGAGSGGDGSSWANAFDSLQDGLQAATSGQRVWVATGVYRPGDAGTRSASFVIPDGVTLRGGFEGIEERECEREFDPSFETVLSGDLASDDVDDDGDGYSEENTSENAFHVARCTAGSVVLEHVRIVGGRADGSGDARYGGGFWSPGCDATLRNVVLSDNGAPSAFSSGSAIGQRGGRLRVVDSRIVANRSRGLGGGLWAEGDGDPRDAELEIEGVTFERNEAFGNGGAMALSDGVRADVRGSVFLSNRVQQDGGGNGNGGGMAFRGAVLRLTNSRFESNTAERLAGGLYVGAGTCRASHLIFADNQVERGLGGGIYVAGFSTGSTFQYVILARNRAGRGGAVGARTTARFDHATVVSNRAFDEGTGTGLGGAFYVADFEGPIRIHNSLVWDNVADNFGPAVDGQTVYFSQSFVSDGGVSPWAAVDRARGVDGGGVEAVDPGFVDLSDPEGPDGQWGTADDGLRLAAGSLAIDRAAGSDVADMDQDRRARGSAPDIADRDGDGDRTEAVPVDIVGSPAVSGPASDLGAYEFGSGMAPSARVLRVDASAEGNADGSSWVDAFDDLSDALAEARAGDELWVASGQYATAPFVLKPGVFLYGGFSGNETNRADRDPSQNRPELSGNGAEHVVVASGVGSAAGLDGFTLRGGRASGNGAGGSGGGLLAVTGAPTVVDVVFDDNQASFGGGLFAGEGADPLVRDCRFEDNRASDGGGIAVLGAAATVVNAVFARNAGSRGGGGIEAAGSLLELSHSVFHRNDATESPSSPGPGGGGLFATTDSTAFVSNVVFAGNEATLGGAVAASERSRIVMESCTSVDNVALQGGSVAAWGSSEVELANGISRANRLAQTPGAEGPELFTGFGNGSSGNSRIAFVGGFLEGGTESRVICPSCTIDLTGVAAIGPGLVDETEPAGTDGALGTADDGIRLEANGAAIDAAALADQLDLDRDGDVLEPVPDFTDVDGDGDRAEAVPWDVLGATRNVGMGPDVGAYERP